ncbi:MULTISPECIES: cytoplasmic protein [Klebsiella]|uniref:cytoplasmic protein n=1 Tax=Klebsiella TaxID=570 RepID=UPI0029279698|nr:cytoplasmic protein [Klebsiella sp. 141203]MDU9363963.1 cytoplasmic protein [Klebsiella sp. 141203]
MSNIHKKYKPRNIINAPHIKSAIISRSQQRGDNDNIQSWLTNHFYRWTIGDFSPVYSVRSAEDYTIYFGTHSEIPTWLIPKLDSEERFYYLNPQHPQLLGMERDILEFLSRQKGTRLEAKLQRINCFTLLAMRDAEHLKMQHLREQGWYPSNSEALKLVLSVQNGRFVELDATHADLRSEMAYESWHMQHCVGQFDDKGTLSGGYGEYYARQIEQGMLRLFSLRDNHNIPHVTISLIVNNDGLSIEQIKGKQNCYPIKKYVADVLSLISLINPHHERHKDCEGMGIVYENTPEYSGWKFITDIHDFNFLLNVLHDNFHLMKHFPAPPVALQWLLLHSAPDALRYLQMIDPNVATAAEMLFPQHEWHPTLAGKNTSNIPFVIESLTLQTTRYLSFCGDKH